MSDDDQKPVTAEEMRAIERVHIKAGGTYMDLMDRAAEHVAAFVQGKFNPCKILILCGPGNNGGDGYGAARILSEAGFEVTVAMDTLHEPSYSPEAQAERNAWHGTIYDFEDINCDAHDVIVDGIFGIGLDRNLSGTYLKVIRKVNDSKASVVSIDIPSGINSDTGNAMPEAIQADYTVTFQRTKEGHHKSEGKKNSGELLLRDVGIVLGDIPE